MPMIGHQAEAKQADIKFIDRLTENFHEGVVILIFVKNFARRLARLSMW